MRLRLHGVGLGAKSLKIDRMLPECGYGQPRANGSTLCLNPNCCFHAQAPYSLMKTLLSTLLFFALLAFGLSAVAENTESGEALDSYGISE